MVGVEGTAPSRVLCIDVNSQQFPTPGRQPSAPPLSSRFPRFGYSSFKISVAVDNESCRREIIIIIIIRIRIISLAPHLEGSQTNFDINSAFRLNGNIPRHRPTFPNYTPGGTLSGLHTRHQRDT